MRKPREAEALLRRARAFAAGGEDEEARHAYLAYFHHDPADVRALVEFGALAEANGYISAACSVYQEAVRLAPANVVARTSLAHLLRKSGDLPAARLHYQAALAQDPAFAPAHQGLGQLLTSLQAPEAARHLRLGFAAHAVARRRYRGRGTAIPILLLVAAGGGNIPLSNWLDDRRFAITSIYADFFDPAHPLPPHALILNAIGDADLCEAALEGAETLVQRSTAPIINQPSLVRRTGRQENARRLAAVDYVLAPAIARYARQDISAAADRLRFPLLLRCPGFHTGRHFLRVDRPEALAACVASLAGEQLLAIDYLDTRGPDGLWRKYRVMFIDGAAYPLHLAVSQDWKVHYFSAAMAGNPDLRAEELRFLRNMPGVLGARAMAALAGIAHALGLDYAGIDFALSPDGEIVLFEANATMVINPPGPEPIWDYRRPFIERARAAAAGMVWRRAVGEVETRQFVLF